MKIALVHSEYSSSSPSGENTTFKLQARALAQAGHDVQTFVRKTDVEQLKGYFATKSAVRTALGYGSSPLASISSFGPDVVHIHNLFPNFGWKWMAEIKTPIVTTLHNFRAFCAAGTAMLNGTLCVSCQERGSFQAVKNKCYRESGLATIPLAIQNRKALAAHPLIKGSAGLVFLSARQKKVFDSVGLGETPTSIIPNFVDTFVKRAKKPNHRWVFLGRLSDEKGIMSLLDWWPPEEFLDIIGGGPLRSQVEQKCSARVNLLGQLKEDEIREILPNYLGVVIPSEWHEGAVNMVHLSSMAAGLQVIARAGSTSADEVVESGLGAVYDSPEGLRDALRTAGSNPANRGSLLARFNENYSEKVWVEKIIRFYESTLTRFPAL